MRVSALQSKLADKSIDAFNSCVDVACAIKVTSSGVGNTSGCSGAVATSEYLQVGSGEGAGSIDTETLHGQGTAL